MALRLGAYHQLTVTSIAMYVSESAGQPMSGSHCVCVFWVGLSPSTLDIPNTQDNGMAIFYLQIPSTQISSLNHERMIANALHGRNLWSAMERRDAPRKYAHTAFSRNRFVPTRGRPCTPVSRMPIQKVGCEVSSPTVTTVVRGPFRVRRELIRES